MTINPTAQNPALENDILKLVQNREVVAKILNQTVEYSEILPYIQVIDIEGDTGQVIGIKNREPKKWKWDYKASEYGPDDVLVHKETITDKDKWIFHTVFSEPIERLAVGDKVGEVVGKQSDQVSYDAANFLCKDLVENYICKKDYYADSAINEMYDEDLEDVQKVGKTILTSGFDMLVPSKLFNKLKELTNVVDTKKLLLFLDTSVYANACMASIYTNPSPVLDELEKRFLRVIRINMTDGAKAAIWDTDALALLRAITGRFLVHDSYVNSHKILTHLWRKWMAVPFRSAWALFSKGPKPTQTLTNQSSSSSQQTKKLSGNT